MRKLIATLCIAAAATLSLAGCGEPATQTRGVYMLMDTSGTYSGELEKAQQIIDVVLTRLDTGDSFAVARIDTGSFSEKDIIAKATFDERPSLANREKRHFQEMVKAFVSGVRPAAYTDITGGVLQAAEYLNEKKTGRKVILIFSDLAEDLKEGYVRDFPLALDGVDVVALNVTKLRTDNIDPRDYMKRLEDWKVRVEASGGRWRVINDLERLDTAFLG
ncbi:MAG TPA: vWA domain-containing protein [Kiloniellales bacterium]